MVLKEYELMEDVYEEVKQAACGRQACSVMLLVATEVRAVSVCLFDYYQYMNNFYIFKDLQS